MRNPFRRAERAPSRTIACDGHWCTPTHCICPPAKSEVFYDGEHDTHFTGSLEFQVDPDPRDELIETLQEQLAMAVEIGTRQAKIVAAARHLMDIFTQRESNEPIFKLNVGSDTNHELIRHATLNLHAALNGVEPPAFCLPEAERIH